MRQRVCHLHGSHLVSRLWTCSAQHTVSGSALRKATIKRQVPCARQRSPDRPGGPVLQTVPGDLQPAWVPSNGDGFARLDIHDHRRCCFRAGSDSIPRAALVGSPHARTAQTQSTFARCTRPTARSCTRASDSAGCCYVQRSKFVPCTKERTTLPCSEGLPQVEVCNNCGAAQPVF